MRTKQATLPHPGLTAGVLTVVSALETEVPPHPSRLAEKSNSCSLPEHCSHNNQGRVPYIPAALASGGTHCTALAACVPAAPCACPIRCAPPPASKVVLLYSTVTNSLNLCTMVKSRSRSGSRSDYGNVLIYTPLVTWLSPSLYSLWPRELRTG